MKDKSTNKDLYVSDISSNVQEEDLRKLFAVCGKVRAVHLITDQKTGQFKGCAFINMGTAAEAKDALNTLDGTRLIDRCIKVRAARPKNTMAPATPSAPEKPRKARGARGRRQ
ncbi:RNA recognition motif. (a.k.a. RRM, RBD, or RNP domain) [Geoalkalibacter ferrihydriticus]|uniref:RNA recognition motif. (A.k.a. RRM, RBD, or RNP domain) n=1 Tax=Geoalkalibacter ferrihydriticus TaxID=392333 RepID=A0A1G9KNU6_9BACT|nr:RNA-binding protein [Geoalkalibacter ferrihydriticus]SDL51438.1 RNA recognition motif. (a.k.a. RRM, RBD, or RNP domain) [Geoalkalibacter ferrihydriticus]